MGDSDGAGVGETDGDSEGVSVGDADGDAEGASVLSQQPKNVTPSFAGQHCPCSPSGTQRSCTEQSAAVVGEADGARVGDVVGPALGDVDGIVVGDAVGAIVSHVPSSKHAPLRQSRSAKHFL